ncbi:MAG: MBOAT family protein, partial [Chitinophagaceae bacterium]|nr:MBOAT family protein [Chitinophagaceae bacterium]
MLFNSLDFVIFLPLVFLLYWHVFNQSIAIQNRFILFASLFFYGWWDWRFLSLLLTTSLIDFWVAIQLDKTDEKRKKNWLLSISLTTNLGNLFFFKYCNFFIENFNAAFRFMGQPISIDSLNIVLPVGISFYTFQTLSYTIDVYKGKIKATHDATAFMAYVSFFPQLVAGPIERAVNLVPQFFNKREYNYSQFVDGLRQMLWGLFKKMVIADNCAIFANMIFNRHEEFNGISMMIGTFFFSFQLYCDFSGYSDIAIGCARLFGFNLMKNFNFPFFSRDIPEYWR